jgi:flagellar FliJ protein
MKKFRFRFESVLRVRKAQENEALSALAASQRAYQAEVSRKEELKEYLAQALSRREQIGKRPAAGTDFYLEQSFITGTKQRITQSEQAIFRASKAVERSLRNYLLAKRQTRVFESLYEKDFQEYKKERAKLEQKAVEDLILMRTRLKEEIA